MSTITETIVKRGNTKNNGILSDKQSGGIK